MSKAINKPAGATDYSLDGANSGNQPERHAIYPGDIRQPWKSVYGFPMAAARLAAGEGLVLTCREDEVFETMAQLNRLLGALESLKRACAMLQKLAENTRQKMVNLLELREQPITDDEISDLIADIEESLISPTGQTVAARLASILSPNDPLREIAGLGAMLNRCQRLIVALERVQESGVHVVVADRQRQPRRPALAARRNESILVDGEPSGLCAGFLLPTGYHLTLWNYLVVRSDKGQAAVWN